MKLPWSSQEAKNAPERLFALSHLAEPAWGKTSPLALMRDGYRGNAVVYRCVRMISEAAASIALNCRPDSVSDLLRQPSPEETGQSLFERLYTDLFVTGNAWLEAITPYAKETPQALYGLRADTVRAVHNDKGRLIAYAVRNRQQERRIRPASDGWLPVLHLRLYDPSDGAYGLSPLVAARKALDLHNGSVAWAKSLIDNAARPSGALIYGREGAHLSDAQFARLKQELSAQHSGALNAGRPLLLEGGLDWRPMSLTPAEMDFRETRHAAAREIALTFGVPPMLLGIPGDNTYATYKEAHLAFWRLTVLPLAQKMAGALRLWLGQRFEKTQITLSLEDVPAFASEREALWARIGNASFLSDQEKRRILGVDEE